MVILLSVLFKNSHQFPKVLWPQRAEDFWEFFQVLMADGPAAEAVNRPSQFHLLTLVFAIRYHSLRHSFQA